jgi:GTP cyclohydrolase I
VTADAGEDVEREELSSTAGRIANWYNHSENQSGGSSENWKQFYLKTQL